MNNSIIQNKNNPFNKVGEVYQICKSPEITYFIHLIWTKYFTTEAERDLPNIKYKICKYMRNIKKKYQVKINMNHQ